VTTLTERGLRSTAAAPWISTAARVVLGGVFLIAGVLKAADPQTSVAAVQAYQLLPAGLVTAVGWGLPFAEIALGIVLLAGLVTRVAAIAAAALLLILVAAVTSAAVRGLSIDCGCFGGGGPVAPGETAYGVEIARDVGLLLLAGWLVVRPDSRLSLERGR
jgi:uncharacterized membrane protein YphA (DoxX/SURF4 family)